jgi:hypothetical protein
MGKTTSVGNRFKDVFWTGWRSRGCDWKITQVARYCVIEFKGSFPREKFKKGFSNSS